jgi:pyroglutamyl-peptidase
MGQSILYSFDPFDTLKTNPAAEVAKLVKENNTEVTLLILPVTFDCGKILKETINSVNPDLIIGIGVAAGYNCVNLECYALNEIYARIPDNNGNKPLLKKISKDGNDAYRTSVDVNMAMGCFKEAVVPARLSFHAGMYVCNYSYYNALEYASKNKGKALFIHVPLSPEEVISQEMNKPSLPTRDIANAVSSIINKCK